MKEQKLVMAKLAVSRIDRNSSGQALAQTRRLRAPAEWKRYETLHMSTSDQSGAVATLPVIVFSNERRNENAN